MLYNGAIAATIVICAYLALMAVCRSFTSNLVVFSAKGIAAVVIGAIIGIFVSSPFFGMSQTAGYVAMAATIAATAVLFFTSIVGNLIRRIPEKVRKGIRLGFRILLIATGVGLATFLVLTFIA